MNTCILIDKTPLNFLERFVRRESDEDERQYRLRVMLSLTGNYSNDKFKTNYLLSDQEIRTKLDKKYFTEMTRLFAVVLISSSESDSRLSSDYSLTRRQ